MLAAQARNRELRRPGERLRLLRDVANLDHVQVDNYLWACPPDASGPDFFLSDLSWSSFCRGKVDAPAMYHEVGIAVEGIDTMRRVMCEAMEDGAFGVSYALIYPPDTYATTDELVEVCKVVSAWRAVHHPHSLRGRRAGSGD